MNFMFVKTKAKMNACWIFTYLKKKSKLRSLSKSAKIYSFRRFFDARTLLNQQAMNSMRGAHMCKHVDSRIYLKPANTVRQNKIPAHDWTHRSKKYFYDWT